jgi:multidrug efflux pump subunit AcrA (membrane-fusion protein)
MYARVQLTVDTRADALTIPRAALVAIDGRSGVFVAAQPEAQPAATTSGGQPPALTARFMPVDVGIRDGEHIEITAGLKEGAKVITTGAGALKDGDRVVAAGAQRQGGREGAGQAPRQEGAR